MISYPWFCKVVIVTPVECHRGSHFGKVIQWWFSVLMVLHIQTVTAPVKSMETRVSLLLGVVKDGVGGSPRRGVVEDVRQQGVVQLGGVVAAEDKKYASADALGEVALVAEETGKTVDQPIAWQKLPNSHQRQDVLIIIVVQ